METEDKEKMYYRIREVAEMLGVNPSTLRFWEKEMPHLKPSRSGGGTRLYSREDVAKLKMVHHLLKDKGLKIDAAKEQLRVNPEGVSQRLDVINRLENVRDELRLILRGLDMRK